MSRVEPAVDRVASLPAELGGQWPVDLAARLLGGAVLAASDESFAPKEHLLLPTPPAAPGGYGVRGKVYDGWETRRRRDTTPGAGSSYRPGEPYDWAVIRLGTPGVVRRVVVDTAHFSGNHPVSVTVHGARVTETLTPAQAATLAVDPTVWELLVGPAPVAGDTRNELAVDDPHRWTHLRLDIHPDGGVARFRAYGEVVPDPALLTTLEVVDLAALEHGGVVVAASDSHYGSPLWLLAPGPPRDMSEGWETARRRTPGHEWVQVRLGVPGRVRLLELDTTHYLHNAPAAVEVSDGAGRPLLARTTIAPDTRARFRVDALADELTLRIYPDGGVARLRAWGTPTGEGLARAWARWEQTGAAGTDAAVTGAAGTGRGDGDQPVTDSGYLEARP